MFLAGTLFFAYFTPFESGNYGAPDEVTHYHYNVEFILNHHRLPVPGQDDLAAFANCFNNPPARYGKVPCTNSYTIYPGMNYVLAAAGAAAAQYGLHVEPYWGARAVSWLWGAMYVLFLYSACRLVAADWRVAALATSAFALIPQVLFVASYVNQDIHSLALSALLLYSLLLLQRRGATRRPLGLAALAFGLIFSAKYNYFIFVPLTVAALALLRRRGVLSGRDLAAVGGLTSAVVLLTSGYWYIRNLVVLHDVLGQSFLLGKMAEYHPLGRAHPVDLQAFGYLALLDFYDLSFQSFFGRFGYMNLQLPDGVYTVAKFVVTATGLGVLVECIGRRDRRMLMAIAGFAIFSAVSWSLLVYNSLQLDFQPQGRYLFPVLAPAALLLTYLAERSPSFVKYAVAELALTLFLLGEAVLLYLRTFTRV